MKFSREWAMPNADTFSIKPIAQFVNRHIAGVTIDPFARNSKLATYTNDLNPETEADCHFEAEIFLRALKENNVKADTVLFDPPYSLRQIAELYKGFGRKITMEDTQQLGRWREELDLIFEILNPGGVMLHFGWHTNFGTVRYGYEIIEILLVAHGGTHYDTICTAVRKPYAV